MDNVIGEASYTISDRREDWKGNDEIMQIMVMLPEEAFRQLTD